MRRPTRFLTIALCATVLGACDTGDRSSVTGPADPGLQASSGDVSALAGARAAIVEFDQTTTFFLHLDTQRDLLSIHLPSDFVGCGGSAGINIADRKTVTTTSAIQQRLVQIKDRDSQVAIFRASSLDVLDDFCGFLTGPERIAEGTVRHVQNLSNASFSAHWGGQIESVDGERIHLSEVYQLRADAHDPNNPATFVLDVSKILLSPNR